PECAESFITCVDCGTLMPTGAVCEVCDAGPRVWNYTYKPDARFHGTGPVFLGMELEVVVPEDNYDLTVSTVTDAVGRLAYLKRDSTIRPCGFEIVTHPMDFGYAMTEFPWEMLEELAELGCVSDAGVGLHVHASRSGFSSPAHVFRWV